MVLIIFKQYQTFWQTQQGPKWSGPTSCQLIPNAAIMTNTWGLYRITDRSPTFIQPSVQSSQFMLTQGSCPRGIYSIAATAFHVLDPILNYRKGLLRVQIRESSGDNSNLWALKKLGLQSPRVTPNDSFPHNSYWVLPHSSQGTWVLKCTQPPASYSCYTNKEWQ